MVHNPRLRVGTSGYQYDHWRRVFYPEGLPKPRWLGYYAQHFDTVEVNNTFYRLPQPPVFERWAREVPSGFCFALKFSQFATHWKHLKDPEEPIERFCSRAERLGPALGPILVQLPPGWGVDPERLEGFLAALPRQHRWAVEFREPSWLCDEVYRLLERHGAALCVHDLLPDHPLERTAGFAYFRYHGHRRFGSYPSADLQREADRMLALLEHGIDVYAYFNNDAYGHAVANAAELRAVAGVLAPGRRSA